MSLPHIDYNEIRLTASSAGKGILIGLLASSGFGGLIVLCVFILIFFRYTYHGQIILHRLGRPGEYDDEQQFARDEADALENMDDIQRFEYLRAKAFVQANPPDSIQTDISLSQHMAIQEKGVSAWEFEPELEIANCFVEARTEIEFFDSECCVQSNLPIPKQNEVYYWEAKVYDKPDTTIVGIGLASKPYPLFRLPGYHKHSVAYFSNGMRRHNQPFSASFYGPEFMSGDVIGVGYRSRSGTIFFTRNGRKLDDVVHGLKSPNLFPTVGANGPCHVHVNFGQLGFVFIEANVKRWALAPMTGSLAPPPPYGSEQGSVLLLGGPNPSSGLHQPILMSNERTARCNRHYRQYVNLPPGTEPYDDHSHFQPGLNLIELGANTGEGCSRSAEYSEFDHHAPPPDYEVATKPNGSDRLSDNSSQSNVRNHDNLRINTRSLTLNNSSARNKQMDRPEELPESNT